MGLKQRPCVVSWIWIWRFKGHICWEGGREDTCANRFLLCLRHRKKPIYGERTKPREERKAEKEKSSDLPNSGFLYLGIIDIWGQIILYSYCCPSLISLSPTDFQAVPQACQAHSCLQAFARAIPSARNALPPEICLACFLISFRSLFKCHHMRRAFCDCPI